MLFVCDSLETLKKGEKKVVDVVVATENVKVKGGVDGRAVLGLQERKDECGYPISKSRKVIANATFGGMTASSRVKMADPCTGSLSGFPLATVQHQPQYQR